MKHLRRFNEKLRSSTYVSAANKLKQIGHIRRADKIKEWGEEVANKEKNAKELENLNYFKNGEIFKINLSKSKWDPTNKVRYNETIMTGNFYLKLDFDKSWAQDSYTENLDMNGITEYVYNIQFDIGIMPADEETKVKFKGIEEKLSNEFFDGAIYPQRLYYKLIDESSREINPTGSFHWECSESDEIIFENRSDALRFKKAFIDSIHGRNSFGDSKWCPSLHGSLKKFFTGEWYDKVDRSDIFNEESFKKFLDSTNRMSVNQLYKN
jgi:hypothetical protein